MNGKTRSSGSELLSRLANLPVPDAPTPSATTRRLMRRLVWRDALGWLARVWATLARLLAPWLARAAIAHASSSRTSTSNKENTS